MCGIAGFVGRGDQADLTAMTRVLTHRGPDGEGFYVDPERGVFLGHRRLAVIDLAGGQQPVWNEDETVCVVFNGEIYNHRDLRAQLVAHGHRFRTDHADTEVLVHGYEEWGNGLLDRLNGMFAFALYDSRPGRLLLARDRFGEKPLFYARRDDAFVFGSELTALLRHPSVAGASVDSRALRKFFAYGFFPAPHTPYVGVAKLPQGHYLEFDALSGTVRPRRYWRFSIVPNDPPPGGLDAWAEELEALLVRSVAMRLESDVPLGIFLSGGIDSSSILSCAAETRPAMSLDSFAIGFTEPSFDESAHAARMAAHVGSRHREEQCDLDLAGSLIPELLTRLDEPLGDSSIVPTFLLCRFARQHVTVALSGDGGDELFAGYDPFRALRAAQRYQRLVPKPLHHALAFMAARLPPSDRNMSFDFKVNRGLRGLAYPPKLWNPIWLGALAPKDIAALFDEPVQLEELYCEAIAEWDGSASRDLVDRTMEFYTNLYLADGILVKSDRASMLNSLEVRAPFLDNELVAFVRRLPAWAKFRHGKTKWLLKRAMARRLPPEILGRPKKGFGIPLARWLRHMPRPQPLSEALPHLDEAWLSTRWREHQARRRDDRATLWCWLALRYGLAR
jgi:asparagine synthase (glutamine-hydrolysing)